MRIAYWVLHYGKEYLAWSIRSVQDAVDEIHVLYSPYPSFGHGTDLVCPDSEEELKAEADRFRTKPLFWHRGAWPSEGAHREEILKIARQRGADTIVTVDSDELWEISSLKFSVEQAESRAERTFLVPFVHFWRSFGWCCDDPCLPVRIVRPGGNGSGVIRPGWPVLHFGYAQRKELIKYKWTCHGHQSELRPGWLDGKFNAWTPASGIGDVHPTCEQGFWTPKRTPEDLATVADGLLFDHPYRGIDLIP